MIASKNPKNNLIELIAQLNRLLNYKSHKRQNDKPIKQRIRN